MSETFIDHRPFLSDLFNANAYANAVLSGHRYDPSESTAPTAEGSAVSAGENGEAGAAVGRGRGASGAKVGKGKEVVEKGDVGVELARLNYGIEDVTKQLRQEITTSYPLLLDHLNTSLALSDHLTPIRTSLSSLSTSLDRLHLKIHQPHAHLSLLVQRLHLLAQASDLTRRAGRFVVLARRLDVQMERVGQAGKEGVGSGEGAKERDLANAALSVAELDLLLKPPMSDEGSDDQVPALPLQSLEFVKTHVPTVDKARDAIIQEMENMVVSGLADLNQPLLSSSLQTAHNLRLLPDLVSNLLADLNDAVSLRISRAFDSAAIGREVNGKDTSSSSAIKFTRGRTATEPTSANKDQWVNALWARLGRVIEDVANCCIKVYTLEKVLKLKRDAVTQVQFLDEVMKNLDEKPSFTFWTTLAKAFESQTKEAARSSAWLQQALSTGYPRLLRLFHDFFAKIAVHTDTVYTQGHQSPEAVLVLRSVSVFESLYLSRSTTRMTDVVSSATTSYLSGRGNPPGANEGVAIARTVTNELDSARFDPLLARSVARNAVKVLDDLMTKIDGALVRDFTATSLIGPHATPAQAVNSQLISCLYNCRYNLLFVQDEFRGKVWEIISPVVDRFEITYKRITDALDIAIQRETASILSRLHRVDFAKPMDPMAMGGGASACMQDLSDKLGFLKMELLGRMSLGEFMCEWILNLSRFLCSTFLLHASIARPLGESGKLKLTGDMTELEMGIASLLSTGQVTGQRGGLKMERVGDEYLALRAFRTLLFADPTTLDNPVETVHLPPLVVLHHIIVLSPLRLPHEVHKWSEAEYVLWVQKHVDEKEQLALLESAVNEQVGEKAGVVEEDHEGDRGGEVGEELYVRLIREVLIHARHDDSSPAAA